MKGTKFHEKEIEKTVLRQVFDTFIHVRFVNSTFNFGYKSNFSYETLSQLSTGKLKNQSENHNLSKFNVNVYVGQYHTCRL